MLVKDLQQFLGTFTDQLKGNAISHAKIYVEKDGYLEEITRMEVQEHMIIGQPGLRLVMKTQKEKKIHLDDKLILQEQASLRITNKSPYYKLTLYFSLKNFLLRLSTSCPSISTTLKSLLSSHVIFLTSLLIDSRYRALELP